MHYENTMNTNILYYQYLLFNFRRLPWQGKLRNNCYLVTWGQVILKDGGIISHYNITYHITLSIAFCIYFIAYQHHLFYILITSLPSTIFLNSFLYTIPIIIPRLLLSPRSVVIFRKPWTVNVLSYNLKYPYTNTLIIKTRWHNQTYCSQSSPTELWNLPH